MKIKIIRDPLHGDIKIFPLEWLIIDTPLFQRLRFVSQLVGSSFVFPGCTHNRFSHSLGAMNICSLYGEKFIRENKISLEEYRILRLACLLHDISHGAFSHQFDESIYKKLGYENGHDDFREKVITQFLPYFLYQKVPSLSFVQQKAINDDLKILGYENINDLIEELPDKILKIFYNKESYHFAIVQGTLGADRLDFIWRDSYFSGVKGFPKGDIERIIANSDIIQEKLVYNIKTVDEIFSALSGRFMLYKNLYFNKTARIVDLMIQQILNLYSEILDFSKYLESPNQFIKLTDDYFLNLYQAIHPKNKKEKIIIQEIKNLVKRVRTRNLWKMVHQEYIYEHQSIEDK
ncbi:MAG: HD domain-containing protein, partial [bacterium]